MRNLPLIALIVVSALWGSHPVVGKVVEGQLSPFALTVWRFTFCAVCYLPFIHRIKHLIKLPRKPAVLLFISGLCWAALYPLLYYMSLRDLSATESLLLVNTSPLLAALMAWLLLRERLNRYEWAGIAVSFAGVILLVSAEWGGNASWTGAGLALLAACAFAAYTVASRSLFQSLPLMDVLLGTSLWGAIDLWVMAGLHGDAGSLTASLASLTGAGWEQLVYIVVVVSTLAYVLYGYGLTRLPAGISSSVTFYPQVVFAGLMEWLWTGQAPSVLLAVSALFILAGTALMKKKPRIVSPPASVEQVVAPHEN